ncbi:MAG: TPM domain-containing protein [Ignavibacteria bacterium]|jgi:uncharacterized membrane protein|nr:TPM domain-containing protein [Ignavibacteria bacterium]MBK6879045.1 TPM domain-containing protein [Ignavibacteria bacterium]MBK9227007.1 TPM domain-containing protein [Ignavibacteria bacterium]
MSLKEIVSNYISVEDLKKVSGAIEEIEKQTRGEIRISLKDHKGYLEQGISSWDLALQEFYELEMDKTSEKTGVLIQIIFREHEFSIVADEGVNSKVITDTWSDISLGMSLRFKTDQYCEGIIFALEEIGKILIKEFPIRDGDVNELSNEIVIRK